MIDEDEYFARNMMFGEKKFIVVEQRTPSPVGAMKASTSADKKSAQYVNDALPDPKEEPMRSDEHCLETAMDAMIRQSENMERNYREKAPSIIAESRMATAQLFHKYREDEERKRLESHKAKEAYQQPVSTTPVARQISDRKRRVTTEMEDEWAKRQGQQQQLNHWMGPVPSTYHSQQQYHQHQQFLMMQQQQQQQMQRATTSSTPGTPGPAPPAAPNHSSPPTLATAPVQPSTSADHVNFCGSSPPKAIDDLSDLPTPGNVDFLAAESEFRCDRDEIKDLGPDIFDEFFTDMTACSSSPMGAPMFSSTPVPPRFSDAEQQHQLHLQQQQQQQQQMLLQQQQQQREIYMKQQAMYSNGAGAYGAQNQQQQAYMHHMRMQQMRYQQGGATMMDPRMMNYYQQQQQQASAAAQQVHPMYQHHLHQQQQFAPHPMN